MSAQSVELPIEGMTCSACAVRLEKALNQASGIGEANVNFALERADVSFDPDQTDVTGVADIVMRAGFDVTHDSYSFQLGGMTCSACSGRVERIVPDR